LPSNPFPSAPIVPFASMMKDAITAGTYDKHTARLPSYPHPSPPMFGLEYLRLTPPRPMFTTLLEDVRIASIPIAPRFHSSTVSQGAINPHSI